MANFPTSVSSNSNLYIAVNGLQTTLAASILATDTTIQLTSTTSFPTTGYVTIDNSEVVLYTGISGSNLTGCSRGADGTTAAPHSLGVTVGATIVAAHHNLLKDEVIAIETFLGVNGANVQPAGSYITALTGDVTATGPGSVAATVALVGGSSAANVHSAELAANAATSSPTVSTIVKRDANGNTKVNTVVENFATTVTAAGTTTLTAASAPIQQFTGTTTQIVTLPNATTLSVGYQITVLNRSTGSVTVNNFGGLLQQTVPATAQTTFTCTSVGSSNGTWDVSTSSAAGITAYREDYVVGTALNNYTGSATIFNLVTPYSVGGHSLVVTIDGDVQTLGASIDYLETNSTTVTFNNALGTGQKVSFIFQTATSSGGTVNSGTTGQLAYFPSTGPTVSGTNDPPAISSINSTFIGMGRNRVINGDMTIDQRHGGASVAFPTSGARYSVDMFSAFASTGIFTLQRLSSTPPTGFLFYNHYVTTTADASPVAGAFYYATLPIEGLNVRDFLFGTAGAVTITLSFWVRSSLTGTFSGSLQNGSSNRSYPFTYTIGSANTWTKISVTISGDTTGTWATDFNPGILVNFDLGLGSTFRGTAGSWSGSNFIGVTGAVRLISTNAATWDVTGVQLEAGSIASAFEFRPFNVETEMCQRNYEKSYVLDVAPGTNTSTGFERLPPTYIFGSEVDVQTYFKVPKRVTPSVSVWTIAGTSAQWEWWSSTAGVKTAHSTGLNYAGPGVFGLFQTAAITDRNGAEGHWAADASM